MVCKRSETMVNKVCLSLVVKNRSTKTRSTYVNGLEFIMHSTLVNLNDQTLVTLLALARS